MRSECRDGRDGANIEWGSLGKAEAASGTGTAPAAGAADEDGAPTGAGASAMTLGSFALSGGGEIFSHSTPTSKTRVTARGGGEEGRRLTSELRIEKGGGILTRGVLCMLK